MQQYQQHKQMTDMGLISSNTAELQSSSLWQSAVWHSVIDGGNWYSLNSEINLLSVV
jgi:hypothetical protein